MDERYGIQLKRDSYWTFLMILLGGNDLLLPPPNHLYPQYSCTPELPYSKSHLSCWKIDFLQLIFALCWVAEGCWLFAKYLRVLYPPVSPLLVPPQSVLPPPSCLILPREEWCNGCNVSLQTPRGIFQILQTNSFAKFPQYSLGNWKNQFSGLNFQNWAQKCLSF